MRNTFRILFYVNKQRVTEGRVPIYVRLSINGKSTFVSSRQRIPLLLWDSAANKAAGKSIEAKQINAGLERIRAKLLHHYQRISDKDAYVSAERVKSAYLGMGEEYETLLEALDKFNRDFKQHVGIDRAQSTYRKYDNVRKRLAEFLCDKLHREDIPLKELTETFITDYDLYLRSEKGLTPSCVCIYTKPLKMIVTKAHNAGLILRNPFSDYHPKKVTKERGYLIESELLQLMNHKFTFGGYGKVRDMFVFSCFTGMAHVDVKGLTKDMLQKSFDGELWIVKKRQKTNVLFKVKLCSITKRIIDNYKREVAGSNLVLPVPDIAYCNRVLKKIAAEVGIDKVISFHLARHRLATENIKPEDVKSVEVMENHQSIRALQNLEYSQQAGLNIKLKEEAKHRWVGVANTGVGVSPFLYDTSLFTMRIAGKWQSMESIRANNTGWNPASQNLRHYEDKIFGNDYKETLWPDYISVDNQSAPLNERRTRDNQSYLVNTTNTWRIGDVYDLKANMTYSSDRLNIANSAFTNYLDSEIASFLQEEYIRSQQHNLSIQLAVQANQPNYYLKDNLTVDVLWNNVGADVLGSRTLSQHAKSPPLKIANDLQLIKRLNNRILSLSSRNMFRYNPQSLSTSDGETHVVQDINSREFRSTTDLRYGWMTRRWQIYIRGGVDYGLRDLENNLVGLTDTVQKIV